MALANVEQAVLDKAETEVRKIKDAGLVPGLHIHYNKAHREDPYVSGHPDPRLNLTRVFTLAAPLGPTASVIGVEENPAGVTLDDERRLLKIRSELITFENYSIPHRTVARRFLQGHN